MTNQKEQLSNQSHSPLQQKRIKYLEINLVKETKVGLKLNIQKTKILVSGPITSWQIDGETVETVRGFILGES